MLNHFYEGRTNSDCKEGRRRESHGCHSEHYHLRPEYQRIWDCLTFCIPKPIKNSCLIPRDHINKFIGEMMH